MTTETPKQTAQIYQFPAINRLKTDGESTGKNTAAVRQLPIAQTVEFGSGWYHQQAIEDSYHARWR